MCWLVPLGVPSGPAGQGLGTMRRKEVLERQFAERVPEARRWLSLPGLTHNDLPRRQPGARPHARMA